MCFAKLVRGGESREMDILPTQLDELHWAYCHMRK